MELNTDNVEIVDIDSLIPDPGNPRIHKDKNLKAIETSFRAYGQVEPLIVQRNTNIVVGGNGRLSVMKKLGWKKATVTKLDLSNTEFRALSIHLNRSGELAEWDKDILKDNLASLANDDFDLGDLGFDSDDLTDLDLDFGGGGSAGLTDPDEIPDVPQNIHGVKRGDIWLLGEHRVMCGDSTSKEDVEKLMGGEKADMVFTDPPYGIDLDTDYTSLKSKRVANKFERVANDNKTFDPSFLIEFFKETSEQYWFGANYYAENISTRNNGSWIVWDKRVTENLDEMYGSAFELCWSKTAHKQDIARVTWAGCFGHNKTDDGAKKVHPTMKPIKLIEWFFDRCKAMLVADLFLGSGSTLIACEKTGRKCYGLEIDEHYCSVVIERWQQYTAEKAKLLSSTEIEHVFVNGDMITKEINHANT